MKKELNYFTIENSFGGNQSWMRDPMMRIGGCGALTACDTCIYMAKAMNKPKFYPFDINHLNKEDYRKFSKIMKPYLSPRMAGINTLDIFVDGFKEYLLQVQGDLEMEGVSGNVPLDMASKTIKSQIDNDYPVPCLILNHSNKAYKDYVWHWFLLVGYDDSENGFLVKIATYGEYIWEDFKGLWNTGSDSKGGLIIYK